MEKAQNSWRHWSERLRLHVRESRLTWSSIADQMELSEGALRHWCNGQREINLTDFFRLCDATGADPHLILFGKPYLTAETAQKLGAQVAELLTKDPTLNPRYAVQSKAMRRAVPSAQQPGAPYKRTKAPKL